MKFQVVPANNALLPAYFQGRWVEKQLADKMVMYTTNLGAEFWLQVDHARFLTLTMFNDRVDAPSWVAIQIDGLPYQRQALTATPIQLTLDGQRHVIRVVMSGNTDADAVWSGQAGFGVESLTSDGELRAVRPGNHSITFIGDSITAGCWVAGRMPAEDYRGEANYAAIASDLLNARNVRIAYSAAGINKPGTGGVPRLMDVLTQVDASTPWSPVPTDVVVINVGTNDGRESVTSFTALFKQFLTQVTTLYPNSRLAVMVPFNQRFDRLIREIVPEFMQIQLIDTAEWQPTTTDGVHLDVAGSQVAGHYLADALRELYPELFA
ncbi:SGNH/GDSL hydrolase family protein [Lactiplantibacillus fabifermentans]|uniref:SGNH hydrolase-type esterase domain-containing protein n=2 Tax=Lactiplantibacillus fabifermentans TaxID=483011 RepID=A0A0R2P2P0_9LACO|nr:SGNH/GDSL hydrolase family protein [Lactiplantibacillus fabifermentans]ETY72899.1 endoglucanase [Lactiplantibacillus fabifermentans T30PCM01]KRO29098.1 hypothetical protein DY78_GL001507 [Lactiplantibacillus fabifermentans DSM 21115]